VDLPKGRKAVKCRWVYKLKRDTHGNINRYKARLVAKGFTQKEGIDYHETFAPVAKMTTVRALLSLAAANDWEIHQMDVNTAFLYGDLAEEIYMEQPEGFENGTGVCRLRKSLYGLKQAPKVWNGKLDSFLKRLGFQRSPEDHCLYWHSERNVVILVYVDDILICTPNADELVALKQQFNAEFDMKDLGELQHFLGIAITRNRGKRTISLCQKAYIESVLEKTGMATCNPVSTPMETNKPLTAAEHEEPASENAYRMAVGLVMYAMTCTRPDIAFAVTAVSRFSHAPKASHWQAVKRILRYLQGTKDYELTYGSISNANDELIAYSDADFAGDLLGRKSTSGTLCLLHGGAISWKSKLQGTVAGSTVEAEYMALYQTTSEAIWLRRLLVGLGYQHGENAVTVYVDNQGAIKLAHNPEHHQRSKHFDIKYHFNREAISNGQTKLVYCPTANMVADTLTKALPKPKHREFSELMGLTGN
jgi:hypothetical protein